MFKNFNKIMDWILLIIFSIDTASHILLAISSDNFDMMFNHLYITALFIFLIHYICRDIFSNEPKHVYILLNNDTICVEGVCNTLDDAKECARYITLIFPSHSSIKVIEHNVYDKDNYKFENHKIVYQTNTENEND